MINYKEKGGKLHETINAAGYYLEPNTNDKAYDANGNQSAEIDAAVQAIIDTYDPLPNAKQAAVDLINTAAGKVRVKYATDIPFQTEAYNSKLADAKAFKAAGYPENELVNYPYTYARATRQGITGQAAADFIIAIADNWAAILFAIEDKRDTANEQIEAQTDWKQCEAVANSFVAEFEAM